jgi:hypothetical protein
VPPTVWFRRVDPVLDVAVTVHVVFSAFNPIRALNNLVLVNH